MRFSPFPLVAILGLNCFVPCVIAEDKPADETNKSVEKEPAKKEPLPDYIRFADDAKSARLEIAIKSFRTPAGAVVDLVGAVHIADAAYYKELNNRFDAYDAVLFELVGDPRDLQGREEKQDEPIGEKKEKKNEAKREKKKDERPAGTGAIHFIQTTAGRLLKLTFQLSQIDYTKPNMVHADATWEEFSKMQKERGESMLSLFIRAMKAQLSGDFDDMSAIHELDTFGLLRILLSNDSAAEFKIVLAHMFDQAESMTAKLEGEEGSAILSGRNGVVMKKIKEVLAEEGKKRIAVFYGAAHMPGIEGMLLKDLKAVPAGEQWLAGWTMPHATPAAPDKSADSKAEAKEPAKK